VPAVKLDGAGTQKLQTLEEGLMALAGIHSLVERMANDVKNQRPIAMAPQQVKRLAVPLQGLLKGQFGMISDIVTSMILAVGRGGGDTTKIRALREHVAQLRTAMEIAQNRVKLTHAVKTDVTDAPKGVDSPQPTGTNPEAEPPEKR
jgi:hypothetical protein